MTTRVPPSRRSHLKSVLAGPDAVSITSKPYPPTYRRTGHRHPRDQPRDSRLSTRSSRPSSAAALSRRGRSSSTTMSFSESRYCSLVRSFCTRYMVSYT
ncbi:hypothetical protein CKAH01_14047 [Colletotrichum kahawae]|uniref:Uncharacterized protein n=1 Tax=Colletotrichum kahawae TaxID=34407 RepID=A0AAD9YP43_COLKA|nr:hypothetical protein CKAH01_14047 [Colletotrichum kahawae]